MKYYQPEYKNAKQWDKTGLHSFEVYRKKENAVKNHPNDKIIEYKNGDIENPTFKD